MENDKPLLSALWIGIQQMGSAKESSAQVEYLMFNLRTQGNFPTAATKWRGPWRAGLTTGLARRSI